MPHLSQKKLPRHVEEELRDGLVVLLSKQRTQSRNRKILGDLLTSTEQLMLSKRLGIVFMLYDDYSIRTITEKLKVSPSTVGRLMQEYEAGYFDNILRHIHRRKEREKFVDDIDKLLRVGGFMPPMGRHRWSWLDESAKKKRHD